jgi:hypothetical protein
MMERSLIVSTDKVNHDLENTLDITWNQLIMDAEARLEQCQIEADRLSKSIEFFKKKQQAGVAFPNTKRNSVEKT